MACIRPCIRLCYDPHSDYLGDHYRLGPQLGKGNFGEVRAARLRLVGHLYSKNVVGKQKHGEHPANDHSPLQLDGDGASVSPHRLSFDKGKAGGEHSPDADDRTSVTEADHRRANADKTHYLQGVMDYPYACKILKKSRVDVKSIMREIQILDACQHDNVLLLVEHFESAKDIYMIMGRCYGDVQQVHVASRRGVALDMVRKWMHQLVQGVAYIHTLNIIHRDIKMPNMLLTSSRSDADMVLGDFGFADDAAKLAKNSTDICGTPLALAPEIFSGAAQQHPTDLWACGITCFEMMSMEHPFSNPAVQQQVAVETQKAKDGKSSPPRPSGKWPSDPSSPKARGSQFSEAAAMVRSCKMKRDSGGATIPKLVEMRKDEDHPRETKNASWLRRPSEFYAVASRFSTNARFVQRFEELAVAVTSECIMLDWGHPRFKEAPDIADFTQQLLTRDINARPKAIEIQGFFQEKVDELKAKKH
jgi:serine/threonine protein kinase